MHKPPEPSLSCGTAWIYADLKRIYADGSGQAAGEEFLIDFNSKQLLHLVISILFG
jgi:hypothetical protein